MSNEMTKPNGAGGALSASFNPAQMEVTMVSMAKAGTPMASYLKMDKGGNWTWGQDENPVEPEDRVYIDPNGFVHGWQCWANTDIEGVASALLESHIVPMHEPLPERPAKVPENGRPWSQSVGMSCLLDGEALTYVTNSVGGRNAIADLGAEYMKQYRRDPSKMIAVLSLQSDSYKHKNKTYGRIYTPVLEVVEWVDSLPAAAVRGADKVEPEAKPEPAKKTPAKKAGKAPRKAA